MANGVIAGFVDSDGVTSEIRYCVTDHQGSVKKIVDENGSVLWEGCYTAFGVKGGESVDRIEFTGMFTGKDIDPETGLTYHWNRWRSEDGSVWLSEDPARDGTNWYGYCGNNPVMFVDSTGLTITNVFDTLHQDDSKNLLGTGNQTIKTAGCVLTAYVRMAQRLGANVSVDDGNDLANRLNLYTHKNELSPQAGAKLVNALLEASDIYNVKVQYYDSVYGGTTTDFSKEVEKKSESSQFFFATARINTSNSDYTSFYEHTLNVNDGVFFSPAPLDMVPGYKDPIFGLDFSGYNNSLGFNFTDTSNANRTGTHDTSRYMSIEKIDFFIVTPILNAPAPEETK